MDYLTDLLRQISYIPPVGLDVGLKPGEAYASYYPSWEVQTPQYISPNPYNTAQQGYRLNEVVYSIINKRAMAISEAPIQLMDLLADPIAPVEDADVVSFLNDSNQNQDFPTFLQVTQTMQDIAGFCAWEIESDRTGSPVKLWLMRPDWCSFLRGEKMPIRAIRYQPWGLPPQDIPVERILLFTNKIDPIFPYIKFISPSMIALNILHVDNAMTKFLGDFVDHGAKFNGLISVQQVLTKAAADDIKARFVEAHGGSETWSNPLVLGQGADYKQTQMSFSEMQFPEVDARSEARICMCFDNISPIIVGAKVGLNRSTYSNYEQAHKAWYREWVLPRWKAIAGTLTNQIVPMFIANRTHQYAMKFDLAEIQALQEDRNDVVKRAVEAAKAGIWDRNEARMETGKAPIDLDDQEEPVSVWLNVTVRETATGQGQDLQATEGGAIGDTTGENDGAVDNPDNADNADNQAQKAAARLEVANFRKFAKKRIKEGKPELIREFEWKFVPEDEQAQLLAEFIPDNELGQVIQLLDRILVA
jgi:HK97 family phage portal protein